MRDLVLLPSTRFLRGFGGGALAVVLASTLAESGEPNWLVGVMVGVAIAGASLWALMAPRIENRWGRRSTLYLSALLFTAGGALLTLDSSLPLVVAAAALLGGLLVSGSDIGPLVVLEQAALGNSSEPTERTRNFSLYNFAGYLGAALGALAAAPLLSFAPQPAWLPSAPRNGVLLLYALLGLAVLPLYSQLSAKALFSETRSPSLLTPEHRSNVLTLAGLFSVDAFGGGLVANTLVAWWLEVQYGAAPFVAGTILFLATLGAGASLFLATPLSQRLGLVRTMVFTHIPSNLLLIAFPFAPSVTMAGTLWVARSLLSQVDVPTRQSFTQAIVLPQERGAAAGYTTAARTTSALGASVTGGFWSAGGSWLTAPFVLAGTVKIVYDLTLYLRFRNVLPPEERPA